MKRTERLDSEFRREIAAIISGPLKDREPNISGLVSVTEVHCAPDLKTAKVYVSVYDADGARAENTFRLLTENAGFIRKELARGMRLRTVPALSFVKDGSMEYGSHMDELLASLRKDD